MIASDVQMTSRRSGFDRARFAVGYIIPILIGTAAFLILIGSKVLNPTYISWLQVGDPFTHYLGWDFFRYADWGFPLGANPNYGLELGNSVLFSDSLPLLALPFKAVSGLLPNNFQYSGWWLLACFLLQAVFAWKLLGLVSNSVAIRALAIGLFLFAPPLMFRVAAHMSLGAHFVVLAGLYLSFRPVQTHRLGYWLLLLASTAMIHPYLLFMVGALWAADLCRFALRSLGAGRAGPVAAEVLLIPMVVALVCWQTGYFIVGDSISGSGFGFYRMNLISIVDSNGWSGVLQDYPGGVGDYEGFAYLGLGGILVFLFALPALFASPGRALTMLRFRPFLLLALFLLLMLAASNNVGIELKNFEYPLPLWAEKSINVFRASGRMIWPVFYSILFAGIFLVIRGYRTVVASGLLGIALLVQIVDTSYGWLPLRPKYNLPNVSTFETPLRSPFWEEAASRYSTVRMLIPSNVHPGWNIFAAYAASHRLKTNAVYLARISTERLEKAQEEANNALSTGRYDPGTLYILDNNKVVPAMLHLDPATDVVAKVDSYNVLAPGWKSCAQCKPLGDEVKIEDVLPSIAIGERLEFGDGKAGVDSLLTGWSTSEKWGTWTQSSDAELMLVTRGPRPTALHVEANALVNEKHPEQTVEFTINGGASTKITFSKFGINSFRLPIPSSPVVRAQTTELRIHVKLLNPVRPSEIGIGADNRLLGLGIIAATLE